MTDQPSTPPPPAADAAAPTPPTVQIGPWCSKAWELVTGNFVLLVVGYLIVGAICSVPLVGFVVGGPLLFGYLRVVRKRMQGEPAAIGDIFQGFQDFGKGFLTILLLALCGFAFAIPIFIVVGLLSVIPCLGQVVAVLLGFAAGFLIQTVLYFVMPIAALSDTTPMEAISRSVKFGFANFGPMFLLALVTGLIAGAGAIACLIGVFFTVPIAMAISLYAYHEYYLPSAEAAA